MRRSLYWALGAGVVLLTAAVLLLLYVLRPAGAESANAALLERIADRPEATSARVLLTRGWGEGRFVLGAYDAGDGRRLALGFALEQRRGWELVAYTEQTVTTNDIRGIGSLLVASSDGGPGQPAWSAAAGQLADRSVMRVEIRWASGEATSATRVNDAFLVLEEGTTTPLEARYLTGEGAERARVPIEGST
jgi:hypothetical protein